MIASTNILGAQYPVMLAGMGGIAGPTLVAAVAEAGGIGTLGLYKAPPSRIVELVKDVQSLTKGVVGVNFVTEVLDDGVLLANVRVAIECSRSDMFVSFFGMPPFSVAKLVRDSGRRLVLQVGSAEDVLSALKLGADLLVVQGTEAGGHLLGIEEISDILRISRTIEPTLPIFVAGGVSNAADFDRFVGNGIADGVCCGTIFVATNESNAHDRYKELIVHSTAYDTVVTDLFKVGWPGRRHRVLNTEQVKSGKSAAASVIARTRIYGSDSLIFRYSAAVPTRETTGSVEDMALYCGVSCSSVVDSRVNAGDVVRSLVRSNRLTSRQREVPQWILNSIDSIRLPLGIGIPTPSSHYANLAFLIFSVAGPKKIEEISIHCGFEMDAGRSLLNAGVALNFLKLDTEKGYANAPIALRFLVSTSEESLTNWVGVMGRWTKPWQTIVEAIRTGRSVSSQGPVISSDPDYTAKFILGMHEYASRTSDDIAAAVDLAGAQTMVDVGGGAGTYSMSFCKQNPRLRSTVLDLPEVLEIAKKAVFEAGLIDRIDFKTIDYRSSSLGNQIDCVLFSNVLHQESRDVGTDMLRRAHAALSAGGKVIVHGHFLSEEGTGPVFATLHNLSARIIWDGGHSYTINEMSSLLEETGFSSISVATVSSSATKAIVGQKLI